METLKMKCAACGASVSGTESTCNYCSSALFDAQGKRIESEKELQDFGWSGKFPVLLTIIGIITIHLYGWRFETTSFFQKNAMYCWSIALPLWTFTMAIIWRTDQLFTFLIGLGFTVLVFGVHAFKVNQLMNGRYFDDSMGAAALAAIPVFFAWMIGRILHRSIRKRLR
jgi:hypothetical protein